MNVSDIVQHKKRKTLYVIEDKATAQCSTGDIKDNDEVIIYKSLDNGKLYVRKTSEFNDGRFELKE